MIDTKLYNNNYALGMSPKRELVKTARFLKEI